MNQKLITCTFILISVAFAAASTITPAFNVFAEIK
jgi:hypothetical protein